MKTIKFSLLAAMVALVSACAPQQRQTPTMDEWRVGGAKAGVRIERKRTGTGLRYRAYNTNSYPVCVRVIAVNIRGKAEFFGYDHYRLVQARGYRSFGQMHVSGGRAVWDIRYWVKPANSSGSCSY